MKKIALLLSSLFLLGACGGQKETVKKENEKVTLRYAFWDKNQEPAILEMIQNFENENPNIEIEIEVTPYRQYFTKLEAAATGDVLPDIFWMNGPNFVQYASNGMLMPMEDVVSANNINMDNYVASLVKLYTYDEKLYGIPKDLDSVAMWYNKDIFDKANLEYPNREWTIEDVKVASAKIEESGQDVYGITVAPNGQESYYNFIPQAGGEVISEDKSRSGYHKPETLKAIKVMKDLYDSGVAVPYASILDTNATDMFESGRVAMSYSGSWQAKPYDANENINKKIGLTFMPAVKTNTSVVHGLSNVIGAKTRYPEAAAKFLGYLGSEEANTILAKSGAVIPAYKGVQHLWVEAFENVDASAYIDILDNTMPYPVSANTSKWALVESDYLKQVWSGTMTPEEAVKNIAREMDVILKEER